MEKVDILVLGSVRPSTLEELERDFTCHHVATAAEAETVAAEVGSRMRGIARGGHLHARRAMLELFPGLEIFSNFGVGYDGIDLDYCAAKGIVVTNTPDVLTEEVADTTIGLLLNTVRELSAAERYLRAGRWASEGAFPLSRATLRNRIVGILGLGRIGMAIARRLDAMQVPVVYHTRRERPGVAYRYYRDLREMLEAVDTLIIVVPGTPETTSLIDAGMLEALGPDGILINVGRGTVVDEAALIEALASRTIYAAGLDVFADEPNVPEALLSLDNVVLLPHVGSASHHTRDAMGKLMVDNLRAWFATGMPLTPVPETPVPEKR